MDDAHRNESNLDVEPSDMVLEPPGTIAIVGAGPLGIEAALYGRFLGYDVTVFEATTIAGQVREGGDSPLPMLPDRSLSSLAAGALAAHRGDQGPRALPMTNSAWVSEVAEVLCQTDLLCDRVRPFHRVDSIVTVPREDDVAPDFELRFTRDVSLLESEGVLAPSSTVDTEGSHHAEAVIVATGEDLPVELGFDPPADYFFRIGDRPTGNAEADFEHGLRQVVALFARLGGRAALDLYRPRRM